MSGQNQTVRSPSGRAICAAFFPSRFFEVLRSFSTSCLAQLVRSLVAAGLCRRCEVRLTFDPLQMEPAGIQAGARGEFAEFVERSFFLEFVEEGHRGLGLQLAPSSLCLTCTLIALLYLAVDKLFLSRLSSGERSLTLWRRRATRYESLKIYLRAIRQQPGRTVIACSERHFCC